jgi:hypothetical protein
MNWIQVHHQPLSNESVKEADRFAIREIRSIRTYFPVQPF